MILCPCQSGKLYDVCCKQFHDGAMPQNALQLMRSRFSAYALNLVDYIILTTHPDNPDYTKNTAPWKKSISRFAQETKFDALEILFFKEDGDKALVIFTAHLTQGSRDATFTEKSSFEKVDGRWLYKSAHIS